MWKAAWQKGEEGALLSRVSSGSGHVLVQLHNPDSVSVLGHKRHP